MEEKCELKQENGSTEIFDLPVVNAELEEIEVVVIDPEILSLFRQLFQLLALFVPELLKVNEFV